MRLWSSGLTAAFSPKGPLMAAAGIDLTEETIFTWGAPPLKFGAGAVDEIGFEMAQYGARRVLILTDPRINELGIPARIADSLTRYGITSEIFDGCHVEPTDDSMDKAAKPADHRRGRADGLHHRADRRGPGAQGPAQAADRGPDHGRDRFGEHR